MDHKRCRMWPRTANSAIPPRCQAVDLVNEDDAGRGRRRRSEDLAKARFGFTCNTRPHTVRTYQQGPRTPGTELWSEHDHLIVRTNSPTTGDNTSGPFTTTNATFSWAAIVRASIVLPVPGGPVRSAPLQTTSDNTSSMNRQHAQRLKTQMHSSLTSVAAAQHPCARGDAAVPRPAVSEAAPLPHRSHQSHPLQS